MGGYVKYLDESLSFEERANDLVSRMTLDEKVSQTVYNAPAIKRLGIPAYNWWNEALHGVARAGVATVFPQAIGMAAAFDEDMMEEVASVISTEARAKYNSARKNGDRDIYKGLTFWSPNVNIFRDPRWGRGHETYGEDPYLTSRLGVGFVKGLQGDHPRYMKAAACAKHYAVHSGPESLRHEFDAVVSQKDLYETYLPAFKACVIEAEVEAVMGAYNRTNSEPCCGSKTLLNDILREKWGFKGHVVSDCWAIKDFHDFHHVTKTAPESAALAINNGCDVNCGVMYLNLQIAYNEGLVTEETIDKAVIRLMTTRMRLGMFDKDENVPYNAIGYEENDKPENTALSLETAKKTLVLLKNKECILPLSKEVKSIAVIGPNADSRAALEGNYCGTASEYVTVLEGIREKISEGTRLYYAPGCHLFREKIESLASKTDRMAEALEAARAADISVVCIGLDATLEGEEGDTSNSYAGGDKKDLSFPGLQNELLENICKLGKPVIVVVMTGSAMDLCFADEHADAIIQAWYPGAQGGRAVASLLFGEYSPSGRLPVTFYRTIEELPEFTDYAMAGRTYRYMQKEALYPFGYGLSYTCFEYDGLALEGSDIAGGGTVARVKIKNTGEMAGHEIVQLYVRKPDSQYVTPNWSLKGFKPIYLQPGEVADVELRLNSEALSVFDDEGFEVLEPGRIEIYVGGSQPDNRSRSLTKSNILMAELKI